MLRLERWQHIGLIFDSLGKAWEELASDYDNEQIAFLLAFLFLGAWFVVQGSAFLVAFVLLVAPLRRWRAPGGATRALNVAGAGLFAWLAARLALVERA